MLQKIREKITGWVAWAIVITIGVVFAVWGIDLSFTPRPMAAKVNGAEVPVEPVRRAYQEQAARFQQAFRGELPEEIAAEIRRGVIEQFVRRELLQQRVVQQGYRISDAALTEYVQSYDVFHVGGRFNMETYRAALAGAGYTPAMFEAEQRRMLEIQQLQDAVVLSSFVTEDELERRVALQRELREIEWIAVPLARFAEEVEVSDADVEARYQATPERWMTPESVDIAYIDLQLDSLAGDVQVSEDDLRAFYETEMTREPERYAGRERRKAAHILVRPGDDAAAAEARVRALRERIVAGEDFAAVATEASEDPGSARMGGELGWVERGMMVPAFEEALFAMEAGTVSEPVRSEFGWHLIRLEEIEQIGGSSFEAAREELLQAYARRRAEDRFYDDAEALARIAFENPDSLEPAATELGYPVQELAGVTRRGGPGIGTNPAVIDAAWSEAVFERRENSRLLELDDGHAAVIRVTAHNPPELRPLQEVAAQIGAEIRQERTAERAAELGEQARARLAAGESIAEVAESLSADFVAGITVVRDDETVPPDVARAAFSAPRPVGGQPSVVAAQGANAHFAVRVLSATPGGLELLRPEERRELNDRVRGARASQELQAYLEHLRQGAKVTVFESALQ
ncbi:MAG TPA: SurA N-terminal domain-containing protein [Gammaproteobacteria bacterium]|nr:SurA N-terminal domain-containing protein [Gammaproteobacteria bacterium]